MRSERTFPRLFINSLTPRNSNPGIRLRFPQHIRNNGVMDSGPPILQHSHLSSEELSASEGRPREVPTSRPRLFLSERKNAEIDKD